MDELVLFLFLFIFESHCVWRIHLGRRDQMLGLQLDLNRRLTLNFFIFIAEMAVTYTSEISEGWLYVAMIFIILSLSIWIQNTLVSIDVTIVFRSKLQLIRPRTLVGGLVLV